MLGGEEYANDLTPGSHEPTDPDHNLAVSWHSYNFNTCSSQSCWTSQVAPVIAQVPVIAGEIGENDCADGYVNPLMSWLDSRIHQLPGLGLERRLQLLVGPGAGLRLHRDPHRIRRGREDAPPIPGRRLSESEVGGAPQAIPPGGGPPAGRVMHAGGRARSFRRHAS